MRYLRMIAILAVAVACTGPSWAENVVPEKLSVGDAVSIALGMNPELKQAEESKRASLANLRVAGYNTTLSMGSGTSLDRAGSNSDVNSLVFSKLSYENAFGTTASLDMSPLGMGSRHGGLGVSLRQALQKGGGLLSSKGLALQSAQIRCDCRNQAALPLATGHRAGRDSRRTTGLCSLARKSRSASRR